MVSGFRFLRFQVISFQIVFDRILISFVLFLDLLGSFFCLAFFGRNGMNSET